MAEVLARARQLVRSAEPAGWGGALRYRCMARRFAGLSAGPDGSLLLSASGEGTVLRLAPR
ncbi:hypothetical protein [Streptomyces sp. SD31]|uniref:hypothetical protein n=1 Tax=Streptomyces sp. SD31 TaxID=3452208 RepID=UPI003F8BEBB3